MRGAIRGKVFVLTSEIDGQVRRTGARVKKVKLTQKKTGEAWAKENMDKDRHMRKPWLTQKQRKLVENMRAGMSQDEAAVAAGYSERDPSNSSYQALTAIQHRMPELFDELGLTDRAIIEKYVVPLLEAAETNFFPFRRKRKDGRMEQMIDTREVPAWGVRLSALDLAFKLKGSYAPRRIDFDPEAPSPLVTVKLNVMHMTRELA